MEGCKQAFHPFTSYETSYERFRLSGMFFTTLKPLVSPAPNQPLLLMNSLSEPSVNIWEDLMATLLMPIEK